MKIAPVQNYGICHSKKSIKSLKNHSIYSTAPIVDNKQETVSFKGNNWLKGFGIGGGIGLVALTIISGGLATPLALGAYSAVMGTAGGLIGGVIDDIEEKNKKDEEDEKRRNGG